MSLARRTLMDAAANRFGWRRAYGDTLQVDALLTEQTETAYTAAADHAAQATAKNADVLHVQPASWTSAAASSPTSSTSRAS
ncbi:hypothetical protein ACQEVM_38035 [Streptomyces sp. CA-243310]|uniref:hypothetical protein n=1 Tax=Streptomyces sp. CA-243310 TaxID=3240056 RepID=UPI003D926D0E